MKNLFAAFISLSFISIILFSGWGCANIIPPSGGPRDSFPPILISALPQDSTTNFKSNRVVLTFDEYVDLQDIQNNLLFTPTFENNPLIEARAKTLTIRFRDSLQPNTTYILNFGNSIRDVNESNVLRNFVYTFSTGPAIDSLEISGNVLLAETGKVDSTLIVILHRDLSDSAVVKKRPTYISRVDASGNFRFRNLPAGQFAVYALGDAGLSRRYQNKSQVFAFADTSVVAGKTTNLTMHAYREQVQTKSSTQLPVNLPRGTNDRRLQFTTDLSNNQQDLFKDLNLNFTAPLTQFDSSRITLASDSVYNRNAFSAKLDGSRRQITIRSGWKEATNYHLILDRDFATDSTGRKLIKTDTLHFTTKKRSDYARLIVRLKNVEATKNPVLQFVQNDKVVFSAPLRSGVITQNNFAPGEYQLRILYDTNANGKWDPGSFFGVKRQPEIVRPIERAITVKPDWDNEFDIAL